MKNVASLKNRNVTWYQKHFQQLLLQNSTEEVGEKEKYENIPFLQHYKIKKPFTP